MAMGAVILPWMLVHAERAAGQERGGADSQIERAKETRRKKGACGCPMSNMKSGGMVSLQEQIEQFPPACFLPTFPRSVSGTIRSGSRRTDQDVRVGGIKDSPPYFHDGRLPTLEDTVEFFNVVGSLKLTTDEKAALVAFLRAL